MTELGGLPADWKVESLNTVCEQPQYGYTASAEETGNTRFLRITDITESGVKWDSVPFCECPKADLDKYLLRSGDIVFARIGATTGKSYRIANPPHSVFASYLIRVRCKADIDSDFLSKFFRSDAYWRQVDSQKDTNLKKGVNGSVLKTLRVPVPPIPEQRKIAAVLGVVQRAIEQQERLIALTTELKKTLLHQLFTQGMRGEPQKQTEIGLVPETWEVGRLGDYAKVLNGYAFKSGDYVKEGVRLIRISNVAIGTLIEKDDKFLPHHFLHEKAEYALKEGDLILSLTRPIIAEGMKFCFVQKKDLPALLNQRVGKFEITGDRLLKDYLSHVVFSDYFTEPLRFMAEGSNQPNISPTRLENFLIPMPADLQEQAEIATVLTNLTKKAELAQRKAIIFTDLFRTLLHQLMTAQIRVHDLDLPELEHAQNG